MLLTEEQALIQKVARKVAQQYIAPKAKEVDEKGEFPWDNIKLLASNDFFGIHIPEKYGGIGADMVSHSLVVEEIAAACASTSVSMSTQALVIAPIMIGGSEEQKIKYVTPLAKGRVLGSCGITEPGAGSDVSSVITKAVRDGDEYVLNGQKVFITNAGESEIYVIVARTSEERTKGISLFIVEKDTPGISFGKKEDKMGIRGSTTRDVILDDVRIPLANRIGDEGQGFKIMMEVFNETRPIVGAQPLGIAKGAYNFVKHYIQERVQFGKPLSSFQIVQGMLADMAMQIEASKLLVYQACLAIDIGHQGVPLNSAMAKCFASDTAMKVTTDAVQMMGGYGFIKEYPLERMMRDAKITQIYEGTNQIQRLIIAKQLIG